MTGRVSVSPTIRWYKKDLVRWNMKRYPDYGITKLRSMKVAQLWAMFYAYKRKHRFYNLK